jgi:outer membrane receptor protein involved in Fe transport
MKGLISGVVATKAGLSTSYSQGRPGRPKNKGASPGCIYCAGLPRRYIIFPLLMTATSYHSTLIMGMMLAAAGLLPAAPAHAQDTQAVILPAGTGTLTGTVLDAGTGQPVAYATVLLLPAEGDKAITAVAADDKGRFTMSKLTAGSYRLRISYVGYASHTQAVTGTAGSSEVGSIRLAAAAQQLAEAVVIGEKPVVEVRPDRLVYNAAQDVSNAGGTAADVLRKAPLLSVDGEGNVKMRGSGNFKVLVNGKPSPTLAQNLADALKGIPAEQIQSVEVITTPPAKYDGEGTAGIINIVMKKGVNRGVNGRVGGSTGNRNTGGNASLNFKKGKIGFTSSGSVGRWYGPQQFSRDRSDYATQGLLSQRGEGDYGGHWYYGTLGLDFDPAEHHSFSLTGAVNGYGGDNQQNLVNRYAAPDASLNQLFTRATTSLFSGLSSELSGTYTRTFAQARREWSVLGQYSRTNGTFGYDFDQFDGSAEALDTRLASYRERSRGRTPGHEVTLQTDFVQPFGEKQTLELGVKGIFRRTSSVADVDALRAGTDTDFVRLPARATNFDYSQDVQAAYATYGFGWGKKLTLSLGGRAERTGIEAAFQTTDTGFRRSYLTLLPNGNAQYAFSEGSSLRLAYSRRITRPFIDFLNPFVDRSDPRNIVYGNPDLAPELTDSYELSYNTLIKTATLNVSGSVRHTGNAIENVRLPSDTPGVTAQTFANVAANTFYQIHVYGSVKPLAGWELSGGPDVQYITRRSAALNTERRGFTAGLNLNTSYKLPKKFTVQAFVYSSLPSPEIQGTGSANLYYSFGVKKKLFKDKADLSVNFGNPFNGYWPYRNTVSTASFSETQEYRAFQRTVRLSLGFNFGQQQQQKQRKQIQNDDQKGGGSKQGGGQ